MTRIEAFNALVEAMKEEHEATKEFWVKRKALGEATDRQRTATQTVQEKQHDLLGLLRAEAGIPDKAPE